MELASARFPSLQRMVGTGSESDYEGLQRGVAPFVGDQSQARRRSIALLATVREGNEVFLLYTSTAMLRGWVHHTISCSFVQIEGRCSPPSWFPLPTLENPLFPRGFHTRQIDSKIQRRRNCHHTSLIMVLPTMAAEDTRSASPHVPLVRVLI
jgi:hypothetical protein